MGDVFLTNRWSLAPDGSHHLLIRHPLVHQLRDIFRLLGRRPLFDTGYMAIPQIGGNISSMVSQQNWNSVEQAGGTLSGGDVCPSLRHWKAVESAPQKLERTKSPVTLGDY